MRRILTLLAITVCYNGIVGKGLADQPYLNPKIIPCRTFLAAWGTSGFMVLTDSIYQYPHVFDLGSNANVTDYIRVTCKTHPGFTVGRAIDRLLQEKQRGTLPQIPLGGA